MSVFHRLPASLLGQYLLEHFPVHNGAREIYCLLCTSRDNAALRQECTLLRRHLDAARVLRRFGRRLWARWLRQFVKATLGLEGAVARVRGPPTPPLRLAQWLHGVARAPRDARCGHGICIHIPRVPNDPRWLKMQWRECPYFDAETEDEVRLYVAWRHFAACGPVWRARSSAEDVVTWYVRASSTGPPYEMLRGEARPLNRLKNTIPALPLRFYPSS